MLVSWTIPLIYQYQIFKKAIQNFRMLYKCITANASAIYGSMLHIPPTNLLLLAATQEPYKKKTISQQKILEEFSGKSSAEWTSRQKKRQKEYKN